MLYLCPVSLATANAAVDRLHRHHDPSQGSKFCLGVRDVSGALRGVAIASQPRAWRLNDGRTLEVVRVATDGARNACSMLLGACARSWFALGGERVITYTLPSEGGASLRAAGWTLEAMGAGGGQWSRKHRPRKATAQAGHVKARWGRRRPRPVRPRGGFVASPISHRLLGLALGKRPRAGVMASALRCATSGGVVAGVVLSPVSPDSMAAQVSYLRGDVDRARSILIPAAWRAWRALGGAQHKVLL